MNTETVEGIAEELLATDPDTPVKVRLLRDILTDKPESELKTAMAELKRHPTYVKLQAVTTQTPKPPYYAGPITRLKASLRKEGDVFRVARNIGLSESDPHIAQLVAALALYYQQLSEERPWNNTDLQNVNRFWLVNRKFIEIPGEIAIISPDHPIVKDAREKSISQVNAHYGAAEDPWSLEFEDNIWLDIHGGELTEDAVSTYRRSGSCYTEYPSIFRDRVFRAVGTAHEKLDDDVCMRYCDHMLRRLEFIKGWVPVNEAILAGAFPDPGERLDNVARGLAGHLLFIQELKVYPCWRPLVQPFVDWLWEQRQDDGFWDFGTPHNGKGDVDRFRLSRNWRSYRRYQDWTASILLMLKDYYTDTTARGAGKPYER